jgi:hypothetical protein
MNQTVVVATIDAVEGAEAGMFNVRLTLHDSTNLTLVMDGQTLCSLADQVSRSPFLVASPQTCCPPPMQAWT